MDLTNLCSLKNAILKHKNYKKELEICYGDFLNEFNFEAATIFFNLLQIIPNKDERIVEILKVFDFVRFPVKKFIKSSY